MQHNTTQNCTKSYISDGVRGTTSEDDAGELTGSILVIRDTPQRQMPEAAAIDLWIG